MNYIYLAGFVDVEGWGDITLSGVRAAVESARAEDPAAQITLVINSPGGDVTEGLAIYNYLRRAKVNIEISGMAASIASIIAMAGQHVAIYDNSSLFIHHAWAYLGGANADEARTAADRMDAVDEQLKTVYASRGLAEDKIAEIMDGPDGQGTLVTAAYALELGLVDEILDPALALAACIKNRNSHPHHSNRAGAKPGTNQVEDLSSQEITDMDPEKDPTLTDPNAACGDKPENADPETDPETPETPDTDDAADAEVQDLKAQVAALTKQLADMQTKQAQSTKLAASVAKAHTAPPPASADDWPALMKKHGYAKARAMYPETMKAYCEKELAKGSIR